MAHADAMFAEPANIAIGKMNAVGKPGAVIEQAERGPTLEQLAKRIAGVKAA